MILGSYSEYLETIVSHRCVENPIRSPKEITNRCPPFWIRASTLSL